MVTFKRLNPDELRHFKQVLDRNAKDDGVGIRINRDTSLGGTVEQDEWEDQEVVTAIRSVPTHY